MFLCMIQNVYSEVQTKCVTFSNNFWLLCRHASHKAEISEITVHMQLSMRCVLCNALQCPCKSSESRTALCVTKEGAVLSDDQCDESRKPATNRPCEMTQSTACELDNGRWYASEWGEVSNALLRLFKSNISRNICSVVAERLWRLEGRPWRPSTRCTCSHPALEKHATTVSVKCFLSWVNCVA